MILLKNQSFKQGYFVRNELIPYKSSQKKIINFTVYELQVFIDINCFIKLLLSAFNLQQQEQGYAYLLPFY